VCPGVEAKLPAPHCEHTVDPDPFEKKPGPQSGHVLAPVVALAVPGAQFWHVPDAFSGGAAASHGAEIAGNGARQLRPSLPARQRYQRHPPGLLL